ncbi:hypothetical protein Tco_0998694, partial [Tanacetum coccineum]
MLPNEDGVEEDTPKTAFRTLSPQRVEGHEEHLWVGSKLFGKERKSYKYFVAARKECPWCQRRLSVGDNVKLLAAMYHDV